MFHIQPDQGIELRFHAKSPGPSMFLQNVNMRFDYQQSFEASRATGYEVMLYTCMLGDATLFSRSDLVETAWRIAQPMLDAWEANPPTDYPNYPAGSWGPVAAYDLIERDGRHWIEVINRSVLDRVPLFKGANDTLMHTLTLALTPAAAAAGEEIVRKGEVGDEMYFISRGIGRGGRRATARSSRRWARATSSASSRCSATSPARRRCGRRRRATCSCWRRRTSSVR